MAMFLILMMFGMNTSAKFFSENCTWKFNGEEAKVNCYGRGLSYIPKFNNSVSYLDLSHNGIHVITRNLLPKKLKQLNISWNFIKHLNRTSFGCLSKLEYIDLSYCNIRDVDQGVFGDLVNLRYLDISYNRNLGFASLPNITFGLSQTQISLLNFNGINCETGVGTVIKRNHLENIRKTNLTELYLAGNRLEIFESGVIYYLPKTIQILGVAENKLTAGLYILEFSSMLELKVINASFQSYHPRLYLNPIISQCQEKLDKNWKKSIYQQEHVTFNINWTIPLPPNLETFYAQNSQIYIIEPHFKVTAKNLRHVYLQNNFILALREHVHTFPNHIETMDMSNNFCSRMVRLLDAKSMKHLNFSHNDISQDLEGDSTGEIFNTFTSLEVLDISFNRIVSLPKLLLRNSNELRYIDASNNGLSEWLVDVSKMSNLKLLDLSENKFATLSSHARQQFGHAFQLSNLTIDISRNGIACTCENQDFLVWMHENKNYYLHIENYTCSTTDSMFDFKSLESSVHNLQKQCKSFLGWYIGCSVTSAIFVTFIISIIVIKNKWKIRYLIYKSKQRFGFVTPFNRCIPDTMHYEYDAFLSYSGQELMFVLKQVIPRLEVNKNLRLLIRDRDYLPGISKVDSTMKGLQESRRTVCIVSKKYLESKWRDYELNMAKVEGIEDRGSLDYVILILLPEVYNGNHLPKTLMDLIRKERYIEYPMESCAYDDFWDRLIRMIEQ
nr:toll-like receptor 4 [Crassostrea gigas]